MNIRIQTLSQSKTFLEFLQNQLLKWSYLSISFSLLVLLLVPSKSINAQTAATSSVVTASSTATKPASAASGNSNKKPVMASIMAHSCAACHGTNGQLGDEFFVPLAGMPVNQFVKTMKDFKEGRRPATLMGHVANGFTDADLKQMAEFFAAVPPLKTTIKGDKP